MSKLRAVIFDMDGTLIDSRELIYQALEGVLESVGMSAVTREDMAAVTGKPVAAMYELLAPGHDAAALERAHHEHHAAHMHLLAGYDGASAVLAALKDAGLKLGIFTGFDRRAYDRLRQFGLLDYFDSVVETTRYTKHKPHPEGLLLGLAELGVSPEEAVYVGDGISDIAAGKAAAVRAVIGVTHGFGSPESLRVAGADYIAQDLHEVQDIISKLS